MGCHILSSRKTTPLCVYKSWHQVWMKKCHFPPPLSHKSSQTSPGTTLTELKKPCQGKEHVNRIAVQPRVFGSLPPPKNLPHIDKRKQSTLSREHQSQLDTYVAGPHVGPHPLKSKDDYAGEANKAERNAEQKNLLWSLLGKSIQKTKRCPVGRDLTSNNRCRRVSPNNKCSSNRINNSV